MLAHRVLIERDRTVVMQTTSALSYPGFDAANKSDLRHYFEYSAQGIDVVEEGLKEMWFGEFLVEQGVLDRYQLFRALQMQDRLSGVRLGECAAALGYAPIGRIEKLYTTFTQLQTVTVD